MTPGVLATAVVCPHPPLLVPQVAGSAAAELDDVRTACDAAVAEMAAAAPELIVTVGGAERAMEYDAAAAGSLAGYGVAWRCGAGVPVLPLSLTIGRWLLDRAGLLGGAPGEPNRAGGAPGEPNRAGGAPGEPNRAGGAPEVRLLAVDFETPAEGCLRLGQRIARRAPRVALLVMGDGSARRSEQAPGFLDARAKPYDENVAGALAEADARRLARLDPGLSAELMVAGRAAWQVLAGAAAGGGYRARLHFAAAPYGVCYFVASWTAVGSGRCSP